MHYLIESLKQANEGEILLTFQISDVEITAERGKVI